MYVEQTTEGFNIVDIPGDYLPALMTALINQIHRLPDPELTKEDKRFLRNLKKQLDDEARLSV